jgi:16S rRNA (adenine1518-N6/adenine1519-N6)-dimethyltransferase
MKPSELFSFLSDSNIRAKKRLSQNFLVDQNIVDKLIAKANPGETIIEIGSGPGAITEKLLEKGCRVIAIEMDTALASKLSRFTGDLTVINDDFFAVDLEKWGPAKIISNIPFHLTAPILAKLLPMHKTFSSLTLVMQKEVADRIVCPPGSKQYSSLSILAQYYSTPRYSFTISRNCFYPRPDITSAAVEFTLKQPEEMCDFTLIRKAFGQRRKMLTTSLKEMLPKETVQEILRNEGHAIDARPEALSIKTFSTLSHCYRSQQETGSP